YGFFPQIAALALNRSLVTWPMAPCPNPRTWSADHLLDFKGMPKNMPEIRQYLGQVECPNLPGLRSIRVREGLIFAVGVFLAFDGARWQSGTEVGQCVQLPLRQATKAVGGRAARMMLPNLLDVHCNR